MFVQDEHPRAWIICYSLAGPKYALDSFPAPGVLLVSLNQPENLNAVTRDGYHELDRLFRWLDDEPSLRVGVVTGTGRIFCVGADLKDQYRGRCSHHGHEMEVDASLLIRGHAEWHRNVRDLRPTPATGFGGLSNHTGKKPIIAVVN